MKNFFTLTIMLCMALIANAATNWYDEGNYKEPEKITSGEFEGWYNVTTSQELAWMCYITEVSGSACTDNFYIANDLDMTGNNWKCGVSSNFNGCIEGNGHTISGLNITAGKSGLYWGFVGQVNNSSVTIKNLTLNGTMKINTGKEKGNYGSVVGKANSFNEISNIISNINITCNIDETLASTYVGGFAGMIKNGTFNNCAYNGTLTLTKNPTKGWAGFTPCASGTGNCTLSNCSFTGKVICAGTSKSTNGGAFIPNCNLGGDLYITDCYVEGTVEITGTKSTYYSDFVRIVADPVYVTNSLTISDAGYNTLCLPYNFTLPTGVTAYKGVVSGNSVALTEVTGIIPAGTGVIVKGTAAEKAVFTFSKDAATADVTGNELVGAPTGADLAGGEYILAADGMFHPATAGHLAHHKAYINAAPSAKDALEVVFGEVTGIETIDNGQWTIDNALYNLNGVRVDSSYKGIVIVNGKKYIK
ncbi:MAG: hypothetical protein Q4F34_03825 [Prevotellaceae bacterium]|nr:hypothetical protein [Prevotellaceae bacterium]